MERQRNRQRASLGNALVEYGLIGTLIALGSIMALTLVGESIRDQVSGIAQAMAPAAAESSATPTGTTEVAMAEGTSSEGSGTPDFLDPGTLPFNTFAEYQNQLQTTGASGTTKILADSMSQALDQLKEAGKITDEQYDILMKLANQGHTIAGAEAALEAAAAAYDPSMGPFKDTLIEYNGQSYPPHKLAQLVGWVNVNPGTLSDPFTNSTVPGPVMAEFVNLYKEAESTGALADPDVYAIINNLSTQIASTGELVEDYAHYASVKGEIPPDTINDHLASASTNLNSAGICQTAGHTDSGEICYP